MSDTKWTLGDWIPRGGLLAWHSADTAADGQTLPDSSGNGRTLDCGVLSTPPSYVPNSINGLPWISFDGSTTDPPFWSGAVTVRHAFTLAGASGANFGADYSGLLSGVTTGDLLTGNSAGTTWFNFSLGTNFKRFDVSYPEAAAPGTFNGTVGIFEVSHAGGLAFDGIQLGKQRNIGGRIWDGTWCEHLIYDRVLTDIERWKIYRYIAAKYEIWQQTAAGKPVFPFPADRPYDRDHGREAYLSEPYTGDPTALIRGDFKSGYQLGFGLRRQEELDAAKAFYEAQNPLGEFAFRDYRFYPFRDTNVRFSSSFRERGSDTAYRFNYGFDVIETS